jgi:hypothetical protein
LRHFTIEVPTQGDLDRLVARLERGDTRVSQLSDGYAAIDPSSNGVQFKVRSEPQAYSGFVNLRR